MTSGILRRLTDALVRILMENIPLALTIDSCMLEITSEANGGINSLIFFMFAIRAWKHLKTSLVSLRVLMLEKVTPDTDLRLCPL